MIKVVDGLPDNVVAIVAKGRVTNEDRDKVLKPLMETSLKRHEKVRLYYQLSCRFPGAAWEDLSFGIEHTPQWERVALVTDVGWVRQVVNALRFVIPGEVRVFTNDEADKGCAWISERPNRNRGLKAQVPPPVMTTERMAQPERVSF